jgi:hypothetical protein
MKFIRKQKKFFFVLCFFLILGCSETLNSLDDTLTIKINGTNGQSFRGYYSILGTGVKHGRTDVEGIVPAKYNVKGAVVICHFKKISREGALKVEIYKNDKIVSHAETSVPYGEIYLKTSL